MNELEVQLTEAEAKISATSGAGERLQVLEIQLQETKDKLSEAEAKVLEATSAGYPEKVEELEGKLRETEAKLSEAEAIMSESAGLPEKLRLSEEKFKQKEIELSALQKRNQVRRIIQKRTTLLVKVIYLEGKLLHFFRFFFDIKTSLEGVFVKNNDGD